MSKLVLVSPESSFAIDSSMFVVNGSYESGYEFDEELFFMLGLKPNEDYCYVGDKSPRIKMSMKDSKKRRRFLEYFKTQLKFNSQTIEFHYDHLGREDSDIPISELWLYKVNLWVNDNDYCFKVWASSPDSALETGLCYYNLVTKYQHDDGAGYNYKLCNVTNQ